MEPRSEAALLVGTQPYDGWVFAHPFLFSEDWGGSVRPGKAVGSLGAGGISGRLKIF